MVRVEQSIEIARPIEEVFAFLTPFENLPRWEAGILEAGQTTPGPLAVGARGRDVRHFMGKPTETVYEVMDYAPPTHFAVRSVAGPTPVTASYTFAASASGTRVHSQAKLGIGGLMGLLSPLLSRMIGRQHAKDLQTLKLVLEKTPS
jgi:carbon monoxide dehydrogenase subunit G